VERVSGHYRTFRTRELSVPTAPVAVERVSGHYLRHPPTLAPPFLKAAVVSKRPSAGTGPAERERKGSGGAPP
jgi:hypothetical protein